MQTRKLGRRAGLTLALCGAALGGALPGGVTSALAACPAKAATALTTGKMVAAVRPGTAPDNRQIYSMDLSGANKLLIPIKWYNSVDPTKPLVRDVWRPRISPDRKSVLFYTGRDDYPGEVILWSAPISGRDGLTVANQPDFVILSSQLGWPFPRHAGAEYSPDGTKIVFEATIAANANEQIYTLDLCAGTATVRSTNQNLIPHHTPSYSHDGLSILYSRCPAIGCRGTEQEIYRMSATTDFGESQLTTDGTMKDVSPIESPDGTKILFNRFNGCKSQIYKMNANGSGVTAVVNDSDINLTPSWDRLSAKLYFGRSPNGTQWQLAAIPRNGGTVTGIPLGTDQCGNEFTNLSQNSLLAANADAPGSLPMARMVASVTKKDGPTGANHASNEIYSMSVFNGSSPTRLTSDEKGSWWPQLSPNRQKILYYKGGVENYNGAELWVMNWDGSGQTLLIPANGPDGIPGGAWDPPPGGAWDTQGHASWSPDGNYIVMFARTASDPTGTLQLWITTSTGQSPQRISNLLTSQSRIDPSWSTNQQLIIYSRCPNGMPDPCPGNRFEIFAQSVYGDVFGDQRMTNDLFRDHDPYMSPDGAEVAFLRQVSCNRWGIFKVSTGWTFPVTTVTTVIDDGAVNALPAWSRDSSTIFFHRLPVLSWESDAYSANISAPINKTALSTGSDHCNVEDPNATAVSG